MKTKRLLLAAITLSSLVYLAGLVYYAQVRPIDPDEGYYPTAARLVWEGQTPYRDFSYPQGPLLPYVYSWVWAVHPRSLVAMRFLSAACGGIAIFLWGVCLIFAKPLSPKTALATFAVLLLNPYWVSWNVVMKTFALANLLMSIAMISLYAALQSERARWYFIGGMAMGACASVRMLYAPLVPCALAWLLLREWRMSKPPFPKTLTFLAGAIAGLLPIIFSFASDPSAFIFNNARYRHLLQGPAGFRESIYIHLKGIYFLLLNPYFTAEMLLALFGVLSLLKLRKKQESIYTSQDYSYFSLAFLLLLIYSATAFIPIPTFGQYFDSPLVPFIVFFVAEGSRIILQGGRKRLAVLALVAAALCFRDVRQEVSGYARVPHLQLSSYRKVAQVIETNSQADDMVLSIWPGYVFESGRRNFPGAENEFAYQVAILLTPQARARYHLVSKDEIMKAVTTRAVTLFVSTPYPFYLDSTMSPEELRAFGAALDANYSLVDKVDEVGIYRRRPSVAVADSSSLRSRFAHIDDHWSPERHKIAAGALNDSRLRHIHREADLTELKPFQVSGLAPDASMGQPVEQGIPFCRFHPRLVISGSSLF